MVYQNYFYFGPLLPKINFSTIAGEGDGMFFGQAVGD